MPLLRYSIIFLMLFFQSCGNESSWAHREYNNTVAHYNIYFNAEQRWLETYQNVREAYKDDFRKPINLFNYGSTESLQSNLSAMDEVIKKASTMIDKYPKSKWVDDAYLLTGKAYFFKGDPVAAMNLFDFVSNQYKDPKIRLYAKIWTVKSLVMQQKWIEAEAMAMSVLKNSDFPKELHYEAEFTLGHIYHQQKKFKQAAELLEKALPKLRDRMDRYRTFFALGQAYQQTGDYVKAEKAFAKVPKYNPPYEITFNAQIEQVGLLSAQQKDFSKANKILLRMLEDDKNIDFKGQIYYRMGLNELEAGNTDKGIQTLQTSLIYSTSDKNQKTSSYLKIGDVYYQLRQYEDAGKYYDSANKVLDETHPDFEEILAKNQIVTDLLEHLLKINNNDSLLRMAEDEAFLREKIKNAKKKEKEAADRQKMLTENAKNAPPSFPGNPGLPVNPMGSSNTGSSFPFSNIVNRKNGLVEFRRQFGERPNVDFWKYSNKMQVSNEAKTNNEKNPDSLSNENPKTANPLGEKFKNVPSEDRKYYEKIPFEKDQQMTLLQEVETSLFESGKIYADKLREYETAQEQWLQLIKRYPNSAYLSQTYFELVKVQRLLNRPSLVKLYSDTLKSKFPESIYLKMLENPEYINPTKSTNNESSKAVQTKYDSMVSAFQHADYRKAIQIKLEADKDYSGNSLQPRFDYIHALCLLKVDSIKAISLLQQIVLDYPNTDMYDRSKILLETLSNRNMSSNQRDSIKLKEQISSDFQKAIKSDVLEALIIIPKSANVNMAKAMISDLNKKEFALENLNLGRHLNVGDSYLIVVENFPSQEKTKFYARFLAQQQELFNTKGIFDYKSVTISQINLQKLVKSNNIESYLNWLKSSEN
jgi:tetratricopeptide (TPR) repeat protein